LFRWLLPQIKLLFRHPGWRARVARYLPALKIKYNRAGANRGSGSLSL